MSCFGIRMDGWQNGCAFGAGSAVVGVFWVSRVLSVFI